jgi:hypothetical protein
MGGRHAANGPATYRIGMGRRFAPRDRTRRIRADHAAPSNGAPNGRDDDGEQGCQ